MEYSWSSCDVACTRGGTQGPVEVWRCGPWGAEGDACLDLVLDGRGRCLASAPVQGVVHEPGDLAQKMVEALPGGKPPIPAQGRAPGACAAVAGLTGEVVPLGSPPVLAGACSGYPCSGHVVETVPLGRTPMLLSTAGRTDLLRCFG